MPLRVGVEELVVRFEGQDDPAVGGVDLVVEPGEVVALLGPSGCGKTTVLRVVAGLQEPTSGRIVLGDRDVTGVPAHRRGVGLMFQDYALFPHRDVGANVAFGLRMQRVKAEERHQRVSQALTLVGLPGWERRAVSSLSGGEQQRVALARALTPEPGVLLLDEPLGALDRTLRDRLVPELAEVFRTVGTTVVYVTHDQAEALAIADRVVVMEQGGIAQAGSPVEVWTRPASPFVARFLGFGNVTDERVVRPDAVHVRPLGDGAALLDGERSGTVTRSVFQGDHSSVVLRLDTTGEVLDALVPTSAGSVRPGQPVAVRLDPAGIVTFEA